MNAHINKIIMTSAILLLANCGGITKKECVNNNWKEQGFKDGQAGFSDQKGLEYQKQCTNKKVEIDIAEYKEGWLEGIKSYCSPQKGYEYGLKNKENNSEVCPVEYQPSYNENYNRGKKFIEVKEEIKKIKNEISNLEKSKESYKNKISSANREMTNLENRIDNLKNKMNSIKSKAQDETLNIIDNN